MIFNENLFRMVIDLVEKAELSLSRGVSKDELTEQDLARIRYYAELHKTNEKTLNLLKEEAVAMINKITSSLS